MAATIFRTLTLLALVLAIPAGQAQQPETTRRRANNAAHEESHGESVQHAVALLIPIGDSGVSGVVSFAQDGEQVRVFGQIKGLKPGKHGFHVHQFGDLSDLKTGKSAGDHFNPSGAPHGRPDDDKRHVGDLGNIEANEDGVAEIDIKDTHLQLSGPHSILGRGLVVHANEDKFTQPSGDAGDRVAVGVIGVGASPKARQ